MTNREIYKILLIYPEGEIAGVRAFVDEFIDPGQAEGWIQLALSPTGDLPATHGWCCFHATVAQANLWLTRFADRLGGSVPPGLTEMPREAQLTWMAGARAALFGASGIYFVAAFNSDIDTEAALSATGLQILKVAEN